MNVTPPEVPTPGMEGGEKENAIPSGTLANAPAMCCRMAVYCSFAAFALIPWLLGHEEERAVCVLHAAQQAETDDGRAALYARCVQDIFSTLRAASEVRCREAASGSCMATKTYLILLRKKG